MLINVDAMCRDPCNGHLLLTAIQRLLWAGPPRARTRERVLRRAGALCASRLFHKRLRELPHDDRIFCEQR
jgi:hypothetical protein